MASNEPITATLAIDESIVRLEDLYRTITGRDAPPADDTYAPIPAEKDPTQHVERQLDRLLDLLSRVELDRRPQPAWSPPLSVWESDSEILVCVDLPGVTREQIEIVAAGKLLTISGVRRAPDGPEFRPRRTEHAIGAFRRSVFLPSLGRPVEPKAEMRDGVLELTIAKEPGQVTTPKTVRVH